LGEHADTLVERGEHRFLLFEFFLGQHTSLAKRIEFFEFISD
jgi:hypothetical protein